MPNFCQVYNLPSHALPLRRFGSGTKASHCAADIPSAPLTQNHPQTSPSCADTPPVPAESQATNDRRGFCSYVASAPPRRVQHPSESPSPVSPFRSPFFCSGGLTAKASFTNPPICEPFEKPRTASLSSACLYSCFAAMGESWQLRSTRWAADIPSHARTRIPRAISNLLCALRGRANRQMQFAPGTPPRASLRAIETPRRAMARNCVALLSSACSPGSAARYRVDPQSVQLHPVVAAGGRRLRRKPGRVQHRVQKFP